jgi:DNA-binding Xre family transcriptional regulator
MKFERTQKKTAKTPEEKARIQALRDKYKHKPTIDDLVASGDLSGQPIPLGEYLQIKSFLHTLKKAREAKGLTLAEVEQRSGIDRAALSRLETGKQPNPTLETLARYSQAIGKVVLYKLADPEEVEVG